MQGLQWFEENPKAGELWSAALYVDYNTVTEEGELYAFCSGELKVSKNERNTLLNTGTAYPAVLDGAFGPDTSKPSKSVKAHYSGTLQSFPDL